MENNISGIWVTWENQRRNKTLSKKLGVDLYEIIVNRSRFVRYIICSFRTFNIIKKKKPEFVFVQNPSIGLAFLSLFLKKIFNYTLVVDEHNAGIFPFEGKSTVFNGIARYIAVKSDFVIVTNRGLEELVSGWGGKPFVLQDPIPEIKIKGKEIKIAKKSDPYHIAYVCMWSSDEPYSEVIKAASILGNDYRISMTGKWSGKVELENLPDNVELTGYISETDYFDLLNRCDLIMVLTKRDDCLNCGAYEAVSLEKPLILSNKVALKDYFRKGVVFTENKALEISERVQSIRGHEKEITLQIKELKEELSEEWEVSRTLLESTLFSRPEGF